jgi:uncharacterized protein YndB with AHSA1/START domain
MAEILHQVKIAASPARVYEALVEEAGLSQWWTRYTNAKAEIGSVSSFRFVHGRVNFQMQVDDLVPGERVAWRCLGGDPEWENTTLTFELQEKDGRTVLDFAHRGWASTEGILPMCSYDWGKYLASLKQYLETGQGQPYQDAFTLATLDWLAGRWRAEERADLLEEHWLPPAGGTMLGMSRMIIEGTTTSVEYLLLEETEQGVELSLTLPRTGRKEHMRLVSLTEKEAIFEHMNPKTPERLTYRQEPDDSLFILLEKQADGKPVAYEFHLHRETAHTK